MAKTARKRKGSKAAAPAEKGAAKAAGKDKQAAQAKGKAGKQEKGAQRGRAQKAPAAKQAKSAGRQRRGVGQFLREVRVELSKVTWPSREELTQSTIVVFIAIAIAALYIAFFDQAFTRLVELIS